MTTITERMEYASAAARDFADAAMKQVFELLHIHARTSAETAARSQPAVIAALIDAAAKVYAAERQYEAAEQIAEGLQAIAAEIKENRGQL